jgi:hypothetical protein
VLGGSLNDDIIVDLALEQDLKLDRVLNLRLGKEVPARYQVSVAKDLLHDFLAALKNLVDEVAVIDDLGLDLNIVHVHLGLGLDLHHELVGDNLADSTIHSSALGLCSLVEGLVLIVEILLVGVLVSPIVVAALLIIFIVVLLTMVASLLVALTSLGVVVVALGSSPLILVGIRVISSLHLAFV